MVRDDVGTGDPRTPIGASCEAGIDAAEAAVPVGGRLPREGFGGVGNGAGDGHHARGRTTTPAQPERPMEDGRSIAALFRGIIEDTRTLLRQEVRLAGAEVSEKASAAGRNAASIAMGGAVAFAGVLFMLGAVTAGLYVGLAQFIDTGIALWVAPLIVGTVVALVGWALIRKGVSTLKRMRVVPERTRDSLKETGRWMQHTVR